MPIAEDQITELKHAYQILGAPLSASASSIKQTYRKLVKRWHPDLYPSGTPAYAEATQMTKLINAAYSGIENAPLRYYIEACPPAYVRSRQATRPSPNEPSGIRSETLPKTDWLEFWIRFVCGALFGALISVRFFLSRYFLFSDEQPAILILGIIGIILGSGFAAARSGDEFWHSQFRRWWMWG
jgi:hypothetical protein